MSHFCCDSLYSGLSSLRLSFQAHSAKFRSYLYWSKCNSFSSLFWHVYVLPPGYFVWPCSPHTHRTEFVTSHNEQKTKAIKCGALQVWPIPTLMPLESKRRQNAINNTDWNLSCYCNSKLPKTYTWSGTFILKDGRYKFTFLLLYIKFIAFTWRFSDFAVLGFTLP
jgi:hypothetical protein